MRVLVTGASGYTGSRLVARLLAGGHSVRALVHHAHGAEALRARGARVVIGDVTDRASLAGIAANIDLVFHLVGTLVGGSAAMQSVLVTGLRNLVDQCLAAGAGAGGPLRSFIFTSNAVVYGDGHGALLDEDSVCRPSFPLGALNLLAEAELREAHDVHRLPVTVLRVGAIYGPGRLSSAAIRQGWFRIIGSGRNWSSRVHIDDLLTILTALAGQAQASCAGTAESCFKCYCVADSTPCAVNDYYGYLAQLLGAPTPRHITAGMAKWRAALRSGADQLRGKAAIDDRNTIGLFTSDLRLDSSRLRADLGLTLRYPSYREGLPAALAAEAELG